jgi:hypothetical protein
MERQEDLFPVPGAGILSLEGCGESRISTGKEMARRTPRRFWIGVASASHVRIGRAGGFMQLCHGRGAPLRRLRPGDGIIYYSPTDVFGARDGYRCFTAIGEVASSDPYRADMGGGFTPMRRDVLWSPAREVPIRPLLERLQLTRGRSSWGSVFRFGLVEIGEDDFAMIGAEMGAIG